MLIQIDGVREADSFVFGAQAVGRGDYQDLDLLKSVEILRGPASALYGSDGLAGAVSFTTKDPSDVLGADAAFGGRLKASYASADQGYSEGAVVAGRQGRFAGLLAYTRRDAHELETAGTNKSANTDRTAANPQDITSNALLGKLVYEPAEGHRFRLTGELFDRHVDANVLSAIAKPPLSSTSVLGLTANDTTKRDRVSLDYIYESAAGPISKAIASVYDQSSRTTQFSAEDRNTAADRTRNNTFDNEVIGASLELHSGFATGSVGHRLVYGGDISRTKQEGVRSGTVPPAGETYPTRAFPTTDYTLVGAYLQDEIALLDGRLTLYPALRYDHYDLDPKSDPLIVGFIPAGSDGGRLSPKVGAVLKATEEIGFFLNYAQGFKAPAPSQVNNAFVNPIQNYRSIPNPDLKPETSHTIEGGVRWTTKVWSAGLTGFSGEYKDFIDQAQVGGDFSPTNPAVFQFVNLGKVRIKGVEGRARAEFDNGFGGFVAASYTKGDSIGATKTPLDSVDPFKLVGGVSYRAPSGLYGGELVATHSAGKKAGRVAQVCTPSCFLPGDFTTLDLTAFLRIGEKAILRAGVFNLTDETYWWWNDVRGLSSTAVSRDAYTQPGRNASISLTYNF